MESRCEIRHEMVLPPATYENDVRLRYNVRLSLDFRTVPKEVRCRLSSSTPEDMD